MLWPLLLLVVMVGCSSNSVPQLRLHYASEQIQQSTDGLEQWAQLAERRQLRLLDEIQSGGMSWTPEDFRDTREGIIRETPKALRLVEGLRRAGAQIAAASQEIDQGGRRSW